MDEFQPWSVEIEKKTLDLSNFANMAAACFSIEILFFDGL
jgi:hypothetical protein